MVKENIAQYVLERGIKQIYISKCIGLSPQSVSQIMKGKRKLNIEEYAKLCKALNLPYDYFFDRSKRSNDAN